jgi:hypothetical protein
METDLLEATEADQMVVTSGDLSVDVLANILGYLGIQDIMRKRRVNKRWKEATKKTIVPLSDFGVNSLNGYNAMRMLTTEMPNLQQIWLSGFRDRHKYVDGEDPDESMAAANIAHYTPLDVEIISNFSKLRILDIYHNVLNGRYPFLFNSFPLLQKLTINYCDLLKWDLDMLTGFPLLKELDCCYNRCLTGNINSLRVLKDTLEKVTIYECESVEGNFMDLADFPHLKKLNLEGTSVTGDIRDVGEDDFLSLEQLTLPKTVYGARGYKLQLISDAPDVARAVYLLIKQHPSLEYLWYGRLSEDSPDWYERDFYTPPFHINFVKAGSRLGYRWQSNGGIPCEVNWLDPEPDRESDDYAKYIEDLQKINSQLGFYRGFHQPPTEEEYIRLHDE